MTKPTLHCACPILLVRDLHTSITYYRDCLGFDQVHLYNDPPDFAIVSRDQVTFMLALLPKKAEHKPHWHTIDKMWNAYVFVDDARSLYEEFRSQNATIDYELHEKPYGCLEFGIQDPDGHDIAFAQDLSKK
ncbi:MAG: VOC family protein [Planctomycetota bacterium]